MRCAAPPPPPRIKIPKNVFATQWMPKYVFATQWQEEDGGLPGAAAFKWPRVSVYSQATIGTRYQREGGDTPLKVMRGDVPTFAAAGPHLTKEDEARWREHRTLKPTLYMPDGRDVVVRCEPEDSVRSALVVAAAGEQCVDPSAVRLLDDGEHLRAGQTIEAAHREGGLSDRSKVDVMLEQMGGGKAAPGERSVREFFQSKPRVATTPAATTPAAAAPTAASSAAAAPAAASSSDAAAPAAAAPAVDCSATAPPASPGAVTPLAASGAAPGEIEALKAKLGRREMRIGALSGKLAELRDRLGEANRRLEEAGEEPVEDDESGGEDESDAGGDAQVRVH